ncbi:MAG: hypothetical protein HKN03_17660, partial [Acidimicrobiales bacterium]|nr:hypothetical protein [Acidimicrobiales bacterium]
DFLRVLCGDEVTYCFEVINSGSHTLTNIVINDPILGVVNLAVPNLASGESHIVCVAGGAVSGNLTNTATVDGKAGPLDVTDSDDAAVACDELASLGDKVFFDADQNGQQGDPAVEPGIDDVTVVLWKAEGGVPTQALATNVTSGGGMYAFTGLDPNMDYIVQFIRPANYEFTTANQGPDVSDSDADFDSGLSPVVDLDPGENDPTIDAGLVLPKIELVKKVGPAQAPGSILTAAERFAAAEDELLITDCGAEVEYCFEVSNPNNLDLVNVVINDPTLGIANLSVGNLAAGASQIVCVPGSAVTGRVDNVASTDGETVNGLAVTDSDDAAVDCGDITLIKKVGPKDDSLSEAEAYAAAEDDFLRVLCGDEVTYCFEVINSGSHTLTNIVINDPILGVVNLAVPNLASGESHIVCVAGGAVSGNLTNTATVDGKAGPLDVTDSDDAAVACDELASLGDKVFFDADQNGQQGDPAVEPGIDDVTVVLWKAVGGVPTQALATNVTSGGGMYAFTGLDPNMDYIVQFIRPANYEFTTANQGADVSDSDADFDSGLSPVVDLDPGENDPTIDAGLVLPKIELIKKVGLAPVAGSSMTPAQRFLAAEDELLITDCNAEIEYCFQVRNPNNLSLFNVVINDPILGIVDLAVPDLAPGNTRIVCVPASALVTGRVDNVASTSGETVNGIAVNDADAAAVDCGDITIIKKVGPKDDSLTAEEAYAAAEDGLLTVLCGDEVTYCFEVINSGSHPLTEIVINDPILGVVNLPIPSLASGESRIVCVAGGVVSAALTNTATVDGKAGPLDVSDSDDASVECTELAGLGNKVFFDANYNGIQDGEPGISNVTVNLYKDLGSDGVPDEFVGTRTTSSTGVYSFQGLDPNFDYIVEFIRPANFEFTLHNVGTLDTIDSDANPFTQLSHTVDLDPGEFDP